MDISPRSRMFLVTVGIVAALAILSSTMSKNPALPLLSEHLGADAAQIGLISAISPIPGVLVSSFAGAYSDRKGRERVLTYSLIIFATAPFLYLFVTEAWQLIPVRFYHGFATAIFMPVAMAAVADRFEPAVRGQMLGTYSSFTMVGRFIAPFLGGLLLFVANFQSVYLACAIAGVMALLMVFLIPWGIEGTHVKAKKFEGTMFQALGKVIRDPGIMITSGMEGCQYFAMGAFETFVPIYALSIGFNALDIGIIMGIQVVSMLLAKPIMGRISDQKGRGPSISIGLLVGAVAIALIPFVSSFVILCALSIAFGITVATVTASTSALVTELGGATAHGSSIGVLSSIMDIGHSIGPFLTGILVTLYSFQIGFGLAAVVMLAGALAFWMTVGRRHQRSHGAMG